jgi:hypothetical protein
VPVSLDGTSAQHIIPFVENGGLAGCDAFGILHKMHLHVTRFIVM